MTEPTASEPSPSEPPPADDPPAPASAEHTGDTAATEAQREAQETIRSISRLEESN